MRDDAKDPKGEQKETPKGAGLQGPHNRFIMGLYGNPQKARALLAAQLPAPLLEVVDLEKLTVEKSHFVDESMAEVESDLLFRIPRKDRLGESVYIYVLWEHQRRRDSMMALRMWVYLGMIYRQLVRQKRLNPGNKLPFVYPLVLFQGTEGWKKGLALKDLIDLEGIPPEVHKWVPTFSIDLIRLDEHSPRILPVDPIARLGLGLMRAVMLRQTPEWLRENIDELARLLGSGSESVKLIFHYALLGGERLTRDEFQSIIKEKVDMSQLYEPNSVMAQIVREKDQEIEEIRAKRRKADENRRKADENRRKADEAKRLVEQSLQRTVEGLIRSGMSEQEVSTITGLSLEKISALMNKGKADAGN